jgi:hypothetical protein
MQVSVRLTKRLNVVRSINQNLKAKPVSPSRTLLELSVRKRIRERTAHVNDGGFLNLLRQMDVFVCLFFLVSLFFLFFMLYCWYKA